MQDPSTGLSAELPCSSGYWHITWVRTFLPMVPDNFWLCFSVWHVLDSFAQSLSYNISWDPVTLKMFLINAYDVPLESFFCLTFVILAFLSHKSRAPCPFWGNIFTFFWNILGGPFPPKCFSKWGPKAVMAVPQPECSTAHAQDFHRGWCFLPIFLTSRGSEGILVEHLSSGPSPL